jgi:hypothetical protein
LSYRKRKDSVISPSFAAKGAGGNVSLHRLMVMRKELLLWVNLGTWELFS